MAPKTDMDADTLKELKAEFVHLKRQGTARDAAPEAETGTETAENTGEKIAEKIAEKIGTTTEADPASEPPIDWARLLAAHGLDSDESASLLEHLTRELGDLPHNKPLFTAAAAFGLGFVLGRMSK